MEKIALSVNESAKLLGISPTCLRNNLLHRADFPSFRVGTRWVISKERLIDWVQKQDGKEVEE